VAAGWMLALFAANVAWNQQQLLLKASPVWACTAAHPRKMIEQLMLERTFKIIDPNFAWLQVVPAACS